MNGEFSKLCIKVQCDIVKYSKWTLHVIGDYLLIDINSRLLSKSYV